MLRSQDARQPKVQRYRQLFPSARAKEDGTSTAPSAGTFATMPPTLAHPSVQWFSQFSRLIFTTHVYNVHIQLRPG